LAIEIPVQLAIESIIEARVQVLYEETALVASRYIEGHALTFMHLYCYCLTQHNNLLTSWLKKKNWPKKWGSHGSPGRCGSIALA